VAHHVAAAGTIKRLPSLEMPEAVWQQIVDTTRPERSGRARCSVRMVKAGYGRVKRDRVVESFIGMFEVAATRRPSPAWRA
jgi:hypothetical protein